MKTENQNISEKYYNEALRYMDNANEVLKKAGRNTRYYKDTKYVKEACGVAYSAVLVALDGYFERKGITKRKGRKNVNYYTENLSKIDKKLLNSFNAAYDILHLDGYYDGITLIKLIETGFEEALYIINKLKV
ncbi:MAG: DUF5618 family protein [Bacteroidetes bacterium]|nr:DUF5618 family protein [Bacteroidota bacterium]